MRTGRRNRARSRTTPCVWITSPSESTFPARPLPVAHVLATADPQRRGSTRCSGLDTAQAPYIVPEDFGRATLRAPRKTTAEETATHAICFEHHLRRPTRRIFRRRVPPARRRRQPPFQLPDHPPQRRRRALRARQGRD